MLNTKRSPQPGWSEQQTVFLQENYRTMSAAAMAKEVGKHPKTVEKMLHKLNLRRTKEEASALWRTTYYKDVPPGEKRRVDTASGRGSRKGVKTGVVPYNAAKPGDRRLRLSKAGDKIWYECISLGRWEPVHKLIYQKAFGPPPKSYVIIFLDGDRLNCSLENLKAISRSEHLLSIRAASDTRTENEKILHLRAIKLRHYHNVIKPRREAEKAAKAPEREARRQARMEAEAARQAQREAKKAKAVKVPKLTAIKRTEAKVVKSPQVVPEPAKVAPVDGPSDEEVKKLDMGRLPNLKKQKAKRGVYTDAPGNYVERVRSLTPAERIQHIRNQVDGLVPVQIDAKTVVYRRPSKAIP